MALSAERAMRLALAGARRASGRSFPNPPVGAVVFRGDRVLGRGYTRPVGGPHAEIVALEAAVRRFGVSALRGASVAVTLEPCCHVGRTGPCTEALLAAGVARVIVGHEDPNPRVAGRGIRRLRGAGVRVESGVLEAECREQHRGFVWLHEHGRPFLALKLAATLDGRIATASGESRWITGAAARAEVHRMRAHSDAVWVGAETALADDPALTARRGGRVVHRPWRILADSRLRVPTAARLYEHAEGVRTIVFCAKDAPLRRRRAVEAAGARVIAVGRGPGGLDLAAAARALAREGVTDVLVEGGGRLAASLLRADLVDRLHWLVAPRLLGADARPALGDLGVRRLADGLVLAAPRWRRVGPDLWVEGRVGRAGESS